MLVEGIKLNNYYKKQLIFLIIGFTLVFFFFYYGNNFIYSLLHVLPYFAMVTLYYEKFKNQQMLSDFSNKENNLKLDSTEKEKMKKRSKLIFSLSIIISIIIISISYVITKDIFESLLFLPLLAISGRISFDNLKYVKNIIDLS